jgi:hypothetical protein
MPSSFLMARFKGIKASLAEYKQDEKGSPLRYTIGTPLLTLENQTIFEILGFARNLTPTKIKANQCARSWIIRQGATTLRVFHWAKGVCTGSATTSV